MRVETLGEGEPRYTIVAGIHGDEPEPVDAVSKLLQDPPAILDPVKFIIAHEEALEKGDRCIESDLNRAFLQSGKTVEHKLAQEIEAEIGNTKVLDLHTTESYDDPFLVMQEITDTKRELAMTTGVELAIDMSALDATGLVGSITGVSVETGRKGTDAAVVNAKSVLRHFLAANGIIEEEQECRLADPIVYRVLDEPESSVDKPAGEDYEFLAENFCLVEKGDPVARVDSREIQACSDFYPVLGSSEGYDERFCFRAQKEGPLSNYNIDK